MTERAMAPSMLTQSQNSRLETISEGQKLNFEIQEDARGPKAVNLSFAD